MLTGRLVVANGEMAAKFRSGTVLGVAGDAGSINPDNLREVSPLVEVAHVRLATVSRIEFDLVVIELIRDNLGDFRTRNTTGPSGSDVLTISTTTSFTTEGVSIIST